jgi:hypothetical protein
MAGGVAQGEGLSSNPSTTKKYKYMYIWSYNNHNQEPHVIRKGEELVKAEMWRKDKGTSKTKRC